MSLTFSLALLLCAPAIPFAQSVTTPEEYLGRPVGVDFQLADWDEVSGYFRQLAEESPRVRTEKVGTSTEGRDFLLSVISSEENLARLDEISRMSAILADPRGRSPEETRAAVEDGKVVLFVSCAMHATETAAPQMAMELAHLLATGIGEPWTSARENVVVVLAPTLNPDGLDHVVSWYRETVGTPYEASGLLKLYQYYSGHDNNRDWFMLTQAETRIVTEQLYSVWHPQVYWDVHQQGRDRERLFVPPFRDPLNPNLDPAVIAGIDAIGSRALLDMTREGLSGVSTGVSYDMWWNGGNRNVPVRHNIIGILTEAASVRLATPVFLPIDDLRAPRGIDGYAPSNRFPDPWPGGWWRLRDIIDYELAFARSLLGTLGREPRLWLQNALEASERAIEEGRDAAPRAWILPSDNRDPAAVRRLVEVLLLSGVGIHVAPEGIEVDGRSWPPGSLVILRAQPYGAHVKDLFEVQRYPEGDPPYDVAGWTLPLLLGVRRVEVVEEPAATLVPVEDAELAMAAFAGDGRLEGDAAAVLSSWHSDSWSALCRGLEAGKAFTLVASGPLAGLFESEARPSLGTVIDELPRIGVYSPWEGSMDEGWLRWILDTWQIPHVSVRNEMLRAGQLSDFLDVLVVPGIPARQLDAGRRPGSVPEDYAGGLAPEGAVAVEEFVRGGGHLLTLGASSAWALELFDLPLVDVTLGEDAAGFSCPGSVLRAIPADDPVNAGLPPSVPVFFAGSSAWREMTEDEREEARLDEDPALLELLEYAPTRLLLSGWIEEPELIEGRAAWIRTRRGEGTIDLFGFQPQYRGWSQSAFVLLFRALFLGSPVEAQ